VIASRLAATTTVPGQLLVVNEHRDAEIAPLECRCDLPEALADLCDAGRVVHVALQLDAAAVTSKRVSVETARGILSSAAFQAAAAW
jgi:hypothetical protein